MLYDERQTVNTTTSNGAFSVQVGSNLVSPHRIAGSDPGLTMVMIFQNAEALTGAGGCSFTPMSGDIRFVRVSVTPFSTGITDVLQPDIVIATMPSALVAERAENLQGVSKTGFLQLGAEALTQANVASIFTNANFSALSSILSGGGSSNAGSATGSYVIDAGTGGAGSIDFNTAGSTKASIASNGNFTVDADSFYVDAGSNRVGIGTSAPVASLDLSSRTDAVALPKGSTAQAPGAAVAGMIRFNTDKLVVEFFNGSAWVDPATGTITSVVGSGGISASTVNGSTTVQLQDTIGAVVSAGSATTVPAITVDAKGRITAISSTAISGVAPSGAAGGDLAGGYPDPTIGKLQGQNLSAASPVAGQFLKFAAGTWANANILRTDLRSSISGNLFIGTSCGAGQSLYWDSASDTIQCQNIAINASAVTAGTLDLARLPAEAKLWATDGTGKISYSSGNVGVGTAAPGHALDVVGDINTSAWYRSSGVSILRSSAGTTSLRSTGPMNFTVGSSAITAATFDSAGNLGIGSTTPGALLDVAGSARVSGLFSVQNGNGSGGIRLGADVNASTLTANVRKVGRIFVPTYDNASPNVLAFSGDNDGVDNNIFYGGYPGSSTVTAATRLRFLTAPALNTNGGFERLTVDGNGLVGIGSTSPKAGLDINTTGNVGSALIVPRDIVANRPVQPVNGMIRYASDTNVLEAYINNIWTTLGTLGGSQSFAGNVNVGGAFTSAGPASLNGGANIAGGALTLGSQNITGVGSNIAGAGALNVAAGGTDQNLTLSGSGVGAVNFGSTGRISLSVLDSGAAAANYLTMKGAVAGSAPTIGVAGTDPNINVAILPKGSGLTVMGSTSATSPGAFVHNATAANPYFGIYDSSNSLLYGMARQLPAPAGTSILGGYYRGLAIGGSSNNTNQPIFGVLTSTQSGNGIGATTFTIYDNNKVVTRANVLDDGGGNVGIGSATPAMALDVNGSARVGRAPTALTTASALAAANATTLSVVATAGYPSSGMLFIPSTGEMIAYTSTTGTAFNGLTRGQHGTTAAPIASAAVIDTALVTAGKSSTLSPRFVATSGSGNAFGTVPPSWLGDAGLYVSGTLYANGGIIAGNRFNFGTSSVYMAGNAVSSNADFWALTTNSVERIRVDGNGLVGIGTNTPGQALDVVGSVRATSFITTSDARLKEDITRVPGLDIIRRLNGVKWHWRRDGKADGGVIAQDVEAAYPLAAVTDAQTGIKAVRYNALFAPLIEAVKELAARMDGQSAATSQTEANLRAENQALREKVEALNKRQTRVERDLAELKERLDRR